jgi:hypothetical protein
VCPGLKVWKHLEGESLQRPISQSVRRAIIRNRETVIIPKRYHTRAGFRLANDTLLFEHLDALSPNPAAINAPSSTWRHATDTRLTRNHS